MIDTTAISNSGKVFDFIINGELKPILIKELTIKEKSKVANILEEKIKEVARKEALEIAKLLPEKERNKFLIETAKSNSKISSDEVNEAAESIFGMITVLSLASSEKIDWDSIYTDNTDLCILAYYFALYGKIFEEKETTNNKKVEAEQAEKF